MKKRLLVLEDGTVFRGYGFGSSKETIGEVVFNTGMTGYQESITDQSYNGQLLTFTYPIVEDLDRAENRNAFEKTLKEMAILQPEGSTATTEKQALTIAEEIGYPVLVRPSYVLGGRGMKIVYNPLKLSKYMNEAIKISSEHPVLIDRYLIGCEVEVDAICDGKNRA